MNNKTLSALVLSIIVIIGGYCAWRVYPSAPAEAAIAVTSPGGGEAWQPGNTRTISWVTKGVPLTDKISVTIRRIPPPPLQEEGQEFDPVIYTDLPNTGSAAWKISPMYPDGTYVLGLTAYASTPITNPVSAESAPFSISHPSLSRDLYPLYPSIGWNASETESFLIGTTTYSGASVTSAPTTGTMNPGSVFTPFERYYDSKLKALGWKIDNYLAAGGHVGGQTGYRKDGAVILTRFQVVYHTVPKNAPSECPCDVTLSLFSGK